MSLIFLSVWFNLALLLFCEFRLAFVFFINLLILVVIHGICSIINLSMFLLEYISFYTFEEALNFDIQVCTES